MKTHVTYIAELREKAEKDKTEKEELQIRINKLETDIKNLKK